MIGSELDITDPTNLEGGFCDQLFAGWLEGCTQQRMPAGVVLLGHRKLDLHEVLHPITGDDHPLSDLGQVLLVPDDFFGLRDIDLQVAVGLAAGLLNGVVITRAKLPPFIVTLGMMGASEKIIEVAKTEKDLDLRNRAIRSLGNMRSTLSGQTLLELYAVTPDVAGKKTVIDVLGMQDNAEALVTLARKESDFQLKRMIVERLVNMPKNKAAQDYLMEIIK